MANVGIIGAGIAGLHLGLQLQKEGLSPTIYTDRRGDEIRQGRLLNTVSLGWRARDLDEALGVRYWDEPGNTIGQMYIHLVEEQHLLLPGNWTGAGLLVIDMRLYLPRLMDAFEARGGRIVQRRVDPDGVAALAVEHDLVVVATGRDRLTSLFERIPEESPFTEPQRVLWAGIVRGIAPPEHNRLTFHIIPGVGEWLEISPFVTAQGRTTAFLVEAIPGGPIESLVRMRHEDGPARFDQAMLAACMEYLPGTRDRIDPGEFAVRGPLDYIAGALTPTVRRGYCTLDSGKGSGRCVVALGDVHILHDPIVGQGGNMAVRTAWLLGEMIVEHARAGQALDEDFCIRAAQRQWEASIPSTYMSNDMLRPMPPHMRKLFQVASQKQAVADAFIETIVNPPRGWEVRSSPENTEAFLAELA